MPLNLHSPLRRLRSRFSGVRTTALVSSGTLALGAATGVLLARGLGPTARGEFVAASIGPQVIASLTIFGIDDALIYLLARSKDEAESGLVYGSALVLGGLTGLLASGISLALQLLFFAPAARGVAQITLVAFATYPLVNISTQVMIGAMRARQDFAHWNACRLSIPVIYLVFVAGLLLAHELTVSSAVAALYAANLLLLVYLASRLFAEIPLRFSARLGRSLLRLGIQNHLIDVGQLVNQRVDQFILARIVSPAQLGNYAIAATYAGLALALALAPSWHLYSEASKQGRVSPARFRRLQLRTTAVMLLAASVAAAVAPVFMTVVFGRAFSPAAVPAIILAFGAPPLALSALRTSVWRGSGRPLPAALSQGAGILVTAIGLAIFAPRYGIIAAAVTSVVAYVIVTAILFCIRAAPVVRAGADTPQTEQTAGAALSDAVEASTT